jgi:hypothetical protein
VFAEGKSKGNVKIAPVCACRFLRNQAETVLLLFFAVEALGDKAIADPRFCLDILLAGFRL